METVAELPYLHEFIEHIESQFHFGQYGDKWEIVEHENKICMFMMPFQGASRAGKSNPFSLLFKAYCNVLLYWDTETNTFEVFKSRFSGLEELENAFFFFIENLIKNQSVPDCFTTYYYTHRIRRMFK